MIWVISIIGIPEKSVELQHRIVRNRSSGKVKITLDVQKKLEFTQKIMETRNKCGGGGDLIIIDIWFVIDRM